MHDMPTLPGFQRLADISAPFPGVRVLRSAVDTAHPEIQATTGGNSRPLPECVGCVGCARPCGIGHTAAGEVVGDVRGTTGGEG